MSYRGLETIRYMSYRGLETIREVLLISSRFVGGDSILTMWSSTPCTFFYSFTDFSTLAQLLQVAA